MAGRDDRFFPLEFQQRIARQRLGVDPAIVPGGHLAALSHPEQLAVVIASYLDPRESEPVTAAEFSAIRRGVR